MEYRRLTAEETSALEANGCSAQSWDDVLVGWGKDTYTSRIRNASFSGKVRLGSMAAAMTLPGGVPRDCGIQNARLHNVTVGDGCLVSNVGEYIANYAIGNGCLIENLAAMYVDGTCSFGNGIEVSVLNETGGRGVMMTDELSAQVAYVMALYRHRPALHDKLADMARRYTESVTSTVGTVGDGVVIRDTGTICGVRIGDKAVISGVKKLSNGSVNSCAEDPVLIDNGVIAKDFIISSGARVTDDAMIDTCFVGQCCKLGHGYTASESLFFANCQGENGEACAIFAGPFTVSHHKSTLLIAGYFSFMNAGSGSNQSNHMYKLGPIHQGILERGSKTSSDSYILWPAKVGAFSLVMGRHVTHSDTSSLPFSYLIEQKGVSYLAPGVNLRSVGTIRDAKKWPQRDSRKGPHRLDLINFNLLSPYTIHKMMKGVKVLENLRRSSGVLSETYSYHSTTITNHALGEGLKYYNIGITKFLGNSLISRLTDLPPEASDEQIRRMLQPDTPMGHGDWVDISGLIAPKEAVDALLDKVESGQIASTAELEEGFRTMQDNYYSYEWTWAYDKIEEYFGIDLKAITAKDVRFLVKRWKDAVVGLDNMLYEDAKKEFSLSSMTGFGADGSKEEKMKDFSNVRGDFDSNPFVTEVLDHIRRKTALGAGLTSRLRRKTPKDDE